MSRKAEKKRAGGVKAPAELRDLAHAVFFELRYEAETIEDAIERAVRESAAPTRAAVKRYLALVSEGEHDADDLDHAWRLGAKDAQWMLDGDIRSLSRALRAALAAMPARQRHSKQRG